jgi:hypothetical protein
VKSEVTFHVDREYACLVSKSEINLVEKEEMKEPKKSRTKKEEGSRGEVRMIETVMQRRCGNLRLDSRRREQLVMFDSRDELRVSITSKTTNNLFL